MAAPVKKREIDRRTGEKNSDDDDQSTSGSDSDENMQDGQGMEIQVDFEGRNPVDPDYHGIKTLLQQLFLKAHIDLGGLTDLIISQNYIGSVVKQSDDFIEMEDDEDDDLKDVFGITTVVNLTHPQNSQCIQQLRELLRQLASEHASEATNAMIKNLLENNSQPLGLLINERFVNIPIQISVPLLENLVSEIKRATRRNMPFNFTYLILICKLYKTKDTKVARKVSKKKGSKEEDNVLWSNPEEEIIAEKALHSFEFSVEKEADSGISGAWSESDDEMTPYRRVLLFEASKLELIIEEIKCHIS